MRDQITELQLRLASLEDDCAQKDAAIVRLKEEKVELEMKMAEMEEFRDGKNSLQLISKCFTYLCPHLVINHVISDNNATFTHFGESI